MRRAVGAIHHLTPDQKGPTTLQSRNGTLSANFQIGRYPFVWEIGSHFSEPMKSFSGKYVPNVIGSEKWLPISQTKGYDFRPVLYPDPVIRGVNVQLAL
jgi:hypothetical protein